MPVVISPNKLYAKNQAGTDYLTANVISDQTTAEQCAAIEEKGAATRASIPSDYTTLSDSVNDLKSAIKDTNKVASVVTGNVFAEFEYGYFYRTKSDGLPEQKSEASNYCCAKMPVTPGETVIINATGTTGLYKLYTFVDSDGNVFGSSNTNLSGERSVIIPNNAVYILINNSLTQNPSGYYAYKGKSIIDKVDDISDELDIVTTDTQNLWSYGNLSGTKSVNKLFSFTEGQKYTISAKITSSDTGEVSQILLTDSSSHSILSFYFLHDGTRQFVTFIAPSNIARIYFYAAENSTSSTDKTFSVTDIQIETGELTPYVRYGLTANDLVARLQIAETNENMSDFEEEIKGSLGTYINYTPVSISAGTGYGSGKFWNCEGATAVPPAAAYVGSSANYYCYNPIPVSVGDVYRVQIHKGSSAKQNPVLITDENYMILQQYNAGTSTLNTYDVNVTASDAAYMLLTTVTSDYGNTKVYKRTETLNNIGSLADGLYQFRGKNIAVIGDSISTNGHYISSGVVNPLGNVPEIAIQAADEGVSLSAYVTYYDIGVTLDGSVTIDGVTTTGHTITADDVGKEITFVPASTDVTDPPKIIGKPANKNSASVVTWWEIVAEKYNCNFIPVCWSGSSITSHEADKYESGGYIYKCSYAWHESQIRKCGIRVPGVANGSIPSKRIAPDMVIIYRGTNDMTHRRFAYLTDYLTQYPVSIPETDTIDVSGTTEYDYIRGLLITINKIHEAYPSAKIVLCTLNYFHRLSTSSIEPFPGYPSRNGRNTIYDFSNAIRAVANYTGCDVIEFDKDGLTYANASDVYYQEESPDYTHPTTEGHKFLGNRALRDLLKINDVP